MNTQQLFRELTQEQIKSDVPAFRPGDTVRVHVKVVEGTRERIQLFEGVVIKRHGGGISETFTVRKISYGVGVERAFPHHVLHKSKSFATVKSVVRNFTTSVTFVVKRRVLKKFVVNHVKKWLVSGQASFFCRLCVY